MSVPRHPHQVGTFFLTINVAQRRRLFVVETNAQLLFDTLQRYRCTHYRLHAFVIMPDHLHLILTPQLTLERAVQVIKGGFSHTYNLNASAKMGVWQRGYTDHRIRNAEDYAIRKRYVEQNPVVRGLCQQAEAYAWSSASAPLLRSAP